MNTPARLSFPFLPTRREHALVGLLFLAGCMTGPAPVDTKAVSTLRPGHDKFEDVQALLGPPTSVGDWAPENSEFVRYACWGPEYSDWTFYFRADEVVHAFGPVKHTWTIFSPPGYKPKLPPYRPPKAVDPEVAKLFVPGLTTHNEIVAAWGACSRAVEKPEGRYEIWWGSHEDTWRLEFDSDGLLCRTPRHVVLR